MATAQDRQVHPADEQVQEREVPTGATDGSTVTTEYSAAYLRWHYSA